MSEKQRFLACRAACYRRRSASYRRHQMASSKATVVLAFRLPSSRGESFGEYCTKTRKGTSLSFWCKVYHALVLLCSKFERDRWSQRGARRQKLLEASGRVGAILTTVASRGCPQWFTRERNLNNCHSINLTSKLWCLKSLMTGISASWSASNTNRVSHTEAETKWPQFCRRCFQMHFLECKFMNFD